MPCISNGTDHILRCGSALALPLPSLGVSSLDLGRLPPASGPFSYGFVMFSNVGLFLHLAQILGLIIVRRTDSLLRCSIADGSSDDTAFFLAFPP